MKRGNEHGAATIHTLFCGFEPAAEAAAGFLLRRGVPPQALVVVEKKAAPAERAAVLGLAVAGVIPDDARNVICHLAGSPQARVVISLADESKLVKLVIDIRAACPRSTIAVCLRSLAFENDIIAAGADEVVSVSTLAGATLAQTIFGSGIHKVTTH